MNVNEKGCRGLIKVIDILQQKGYYTFFAFDDHSPIDLIAVDKQSNVYKLQVKYRAKDIDKKYVISTDTIVNGKRVQIDLNLIDGWAIYLEEDKKVVFYSKKLLGKKKHPTINPNKDYGELTEWDLRTVC